MSPSQVAFPGDFVGGFTNSNTSNTSNTGKLDGNTSSQNNQNTNNQHINQNINTNNQNINQNINASTNTQNQNNPNSLQPLCSIKKELHFPYVRHHTVVGYHRKVESVRQFIAKKILNPPQDPETICLIKADTLEYMFPQVDMAYYFQEGPDDPYLWDAAFQKKTINVYSEKYKSQGIFI